MTRAIMGLFRSQVFLDWRHLFSSSNRDRLTTLAFIVTAVATGALAWSGHALLLPVACLFPMLWAFAPTRVAAAMVSMGYFLAASRALPQGAAIYLDIGLIAGIGLWISASLSFVLVHTVLWTPKSGLRRAAQYGLTIMLMAVPPFGITGWASPITAAGVLFPGWGWFGLMVTVAGLLAMTTRVWPVATAAFGSAWMLSVATWTPPAVPDGWIGINTSFDYSDKSKANYLEQHLATIAMVKQAAVEGYSVIVLPESAFGTWTPTTQRLWEGNLKGLDVTILGGAIVVYDTGYDNVMVSVTAISSEIIYRQRMPVPFAMWRPWAIGGAHAGFFRNPASKVAGKSVAPLICYEQLIVWPVLESMLFSPSVIVAQANAWWTGDTNIASVQIMGAYAWARLFDLSLVPAFNTSSQIVHSKGD